MEPFAWTLLLILLAHLLFEWITETLNLKKASPALPTHLSTFIDSEKYAKSQSYLKENTRHSLKQTTFNTFLLIAFLYSGAINLLINWGSTLTPSPILQALFFFGSIGLASLLLNLPFSIHSTFSIEARYGFNTTTVKTYIGDTIKQLLIGALLGAGVLSLLIWFFHATQDLAWLYCWGALTLLQLILLFVAPVWILPLFNKFTPLPQGELKQTIEEYAKQHHFSLKGIYTMDGSKRSNKSNAFFTGFGKIRRIVLFDTLVKKFSIDELLSILAHEMGHCKKRHVFKMLLVSFISTGLMLYLFSLVLNNASLFTAFHLTQPTIYGSLFFFFILYSPIQTILALLTNYFSRKHEFEADAYAIETVNKPQAFADALKKLSIDHLANLTPHPLKVITSYSHPPILERLEAISTHS